MKESKTQKCNFHGGKSTGPRTLEGRQRISKANLVHGDETVQKRAERQRKAVWFKQVENVLLDSPKFAQMTWSIDKNSELPNEQNNPNLRRNR